MSTPWKLIWPVTVAISSFIRFKLRNKVDFPDPEAPISAVIWWAGNSMLTSVTTGFSP